jgi:hypothetical protein
MSKQFVVVVDQSEPPGELNAVQAFGPFSLRTADAIMGDISSEAIAGDISINSVVVAPLNEGVYNLNAITSLLTPDPDDRVPDDRVPDGTYGQARERGED